jgi:hypothetical protein
MLFDLFSSNIEIKIFEENHHRRVRHCKMKKRKSRLKQTGFLMHSSFIILHSAFVLQRRTSAFVSCLTSFGEAGTPAPACRSASGTQAGINRRTGLLIFRDFLFWKKKVPERKTCHNRNARSTASPPRALYIAFYHHAISAF